MDAGGQLCPCVNVVLLRGQLFYSELSILLTTKFKRYPVFTVWYRRFNVCLTTGQMGFQNVIVHRPLSSGNRLVLSPISGINSGKRYSVTKSFLRKGAIFVHFSDVRSVADIYC